MRTDNDTEVNSYRLGVHPTTLELVPLAKHSSSHLCLSPSFCREEAFLPSHLSPLALSLFHLGPGVHRLVVSHDVPSGLMAET